MIDIDIGTMSESRYQQRTLVMFVLDRIESAEPRARRLIRGPYHRNDATLTGPSRCRFLAMFTHTRDADKIGATDQPAHNMLRFVWVRVRVMCVKMCQIIGVATEAAGLAGRQRSVTEPPLIWQLLGKCASFGK